MQVVRRSLLERLHGRLDVAVRRNQDHLGVGLLLLGLAEDRHSVEVAHPQIGDDEVELVLVDLLRAGLAAGRHGAIVADPLEAVGDRVGVQRLVVDHQHGQGGVFDWFFFTCH